MFVIVLFFSVEKHNTGCIGNFLVGFQKVADIAYGALFSQKNHWIPQINED